MPFEYKKLIAAVMFAIVIMTTAMAFRPAPPPGTPHLIIDPEPRVAYVYIDAAVIDTIAQVVFITGLDFPIGADSFTVTPDWPTDTLPVFILLQDYTESEYFIAPGAQTVIPIENSFLTMRITAEFSVRRALTGPPGPWTWGRIFALNPPFVGISENLIPTENSRIRLMLPPEMLPGDCEGYFSNRKVADNFILWDYIADTPLERRCTFRSEE